MNEKNLIMYYNKFNEDKRFDSRHGIIEFRTTLKYIEDYLNRYDNPSIIEVGAGSGRYSVYLADKGYDVTAVELVKSNLNALKRKNSTVKAFLGNAINLKKFKDDSFDVVLLLGPMYHLINKEEKIKALNEAKRIVKKDGVIMSSYYMNDYGVIIHGFRDNNIIDSFNNGLIDKNFKIISKEDDLYSFVTIKDINELNDICNLKRVKILAQDGPSDYMRPIINKMDEETFEIYMNYHLSTCEREDLLGASSHVLDIVKK